MPDTVSIDSVYAKIEQKETTTGSVEGIQFYLDVGTPDDEDSKFLWKLIETYKFRSEIIAEYIYYGADSIVSIEEDSLKVCWRTQEIPEIFTYSTINLTLPKIRNFPLHYVDNQTKRISERYSLLVNQYTISDDTYHYWNEIKKQNEESSSLYSKQPFHITGNLINIDNPENVILGHFMVAGVSKKRIYVNRPSISFPIACESRHDYFIGVITSPNPKLPIYVTNLGGDGGVVWGSTYESCFDCRMHGGSHNKPDFWED